MITIKPILLTIAVLLLPIALFAQPNDDARALVKEGMALNDQKQYTAAIEKYTLALKIDTGYLMADYQMASSLYALNKGTDGIPYLQKVISNNTSLKFAAYDLLGLIHFRDKRYAEAEKCAVEAIKLDPKHAGTQRMYALVCFHQNKRAEALLGFCSFILLEPNTPRSAEAFGNIQHILNGGDVKAALGDKSPLDGSATNIALNQIIANAISAAAKQKHTSTGDLLTAQLKAIFIGIGQLMEKQTDHVFLRKYLAAYFYQLAQSNNMPAFARFINQISPESTKWISEHPQYMNDLYSWIKTTGRGF